MSCAWEKQETWGLNICPQHSSGRDTTPPLVPMARYPTVQAMEALEPHIYIFNSIVSGLVICRGSPDPSFCLTPDYSKSISIDTMTTHSELCLDVLFFYGHSHSRSLIGRSPSLLLCLGRLFFYHFSAPILLPSFLPIRSYSSIFLPTGPPPYSSIILPTIRSTSFYLLQNVCKKCL